MHHKTHRYHIPITFRLLLLGALLAFSNLKAESQPAVGNIAVVNAYGTPCDVMHVLSAYQVGAEVWASSVMETPSQGCITLAIAIATKHSQQIRLKAPSLVVRNIGNFNLSESEWDRWNQEYVGNGKLLYRHGDITSTYDPGLGTGWVDTMALGWAYVAFYPHIYIQDIGWFYIEEGPILSSDDLHIWRYGNDHFVARDSPYELNTYNLWNETYGWIMASSFTRPYVYQYSTESWMELSPPISPATMVTDGAE
ncbi:hypothetical protein [Rubellicoccus peritrichatus]|uniref:Uncharacterized protein n=1 Tax=Rubellicoccus peritrichatus TaxID=3080537 RepID=A0AAQ3LB94_9BACT|nr:hypothetical protein [Puniceicoccus sp. CR14]WOO42665.1 hypothetical protein RZN69_06140 [Puniceicoccus sp. CR14]